MNFNNQYQYNKQYNGPHDFLRIPPFCIEPGVQLLPKNADFWPQLFDLVKNCHHHLVKNGRIHYFFFRSKNFYLLFFLYRKKITVYSSFGKMKLFFIYSTILQYALWACQVHALSIFSFKRYNNDIKKRVNWPIRTQLFSDKNVADFFLNMKILRDHNFELKNVYKI